ncbi:discoidin domain-containing protein [Roseateles koreensis]|uniref:Discoidin domain-containing protein n=1 Tax=Roseateles koreensis TaxID=2987526 RepID=A0ABT5KWT7_9BURK|nr:discoidin domain-containing protein [Roseateles koreensis]MDC8786291.1 discoidin domain-containing protein [Roseateles koreensis]
MQHKLAKMLAALGAALVVSVVQAKPAPGASPSPLPAGVVRSEMLDDFKPAGKLAKGAPPVSQWSAQGSDQVRATLSLERAGGLCMDYDFSGVSGSAVMRRSLPLNWPERFDLVARIKGSGGPNDLQVKLIDVSGENVWWAGKPAQTWPLKPLDLRLRSRQFEFAWGPAKDKRLRQTQFIEFVVSNTGSERAAGKGRLCLSQLEMQERQPTPQVWPDPVISVDSGFVDFDFQRLREFNGLALRWPAFARGVNYEILASDDGKAWRLLRAVKGSDGGLDAVFLPDSETRYLRVRSNVMAQPLVSLRTAAQWPHMNAVVASLVQDAPRPEVLRGDVPRSWLGEQNYWTLVGVDGGGSRSALFSEDGALEVGRGAYSVEPAVKLDDGTVVTWAAVKAQQSLRDGYLPLPLVQWQHSAFTLEMEAAADGPRAAPALMARYVLRNTSDRRQIYTLMLALRPWQVSPPQQLGLPGGVSGIHSLRWVNNEMQVNGTPGLRPTEAPQAVTGVTFDTGLNLKVLQNGAALGSLSDSEDMASGLLQFRVSLAPGEVKTWAWAAPLGGAESKAPKISVGSVADLEQRMDLVAALWRERLNRVSITVSGADQRIPNTLRSALAHVLMARDGAALRPGTRANARTWIRGGASMVEALARLGELDAAREFADWYGERIFVNGKVPCCVDGHGADPTVENDSPGQYLYLVAEIWRHSHDHEFLVHHWPRVQAVQAWMEGLRQSERDQDKRQPERAHLFGLMPPSISHEGYSDRPAYSYWDNFWALRGYKDAVVIARALGHHQVAEQWSAQRDEFQGDLVASVAASAKRFHIDTLAGAADRGDFDPASSAIALNPAQAQEILPPELLKGTFERYWSESHARSEGQRTWTNYSPYELRTIGAFVRLGAVGRAHDTLEFFFKDQRPRGWNQWAELVLPEAREPRFLGDMPHAGVSSEFIRASLDMFGYERESAGQLLIGAGLKPAWLAQGEVAVRGLSTPFGPLSYSLVKMDWGWRLDMEQAGAPTRLVWPGQLSLPRAVADGKPLTWQGRELPLPVAPATIQLSAD